MDRNSATSILRFRSVVYRVISPAPARSIVLISILNLMLANAVAQDGACCVTGGGAIQCFTVSEAQCAEFGGIFHGPDSSCDPFPCNGGLTGACCAANGASCFTSTEVNCVNSGGTFLGIGSSCDPYPCDLPATGACCLEDVQFCFDTDEVQCAIFKGTFSKGASCADLKCGDDPPKDPVGACCTVSIFGVSCVVASEASCISSNGTYQGDDTACDPPPCDPGSGPIGACCLVGGGAILCGVLHESHCAELGGTFLGQDTTCEPNPCIPEGDSNRDGNVDVDDLLAVVNAWGPCPSQGPCDADLDQSGAVDVDDLLTVINNWSA